MNTNKHNDIDKLNEFLSNELAAVETYRQLMEKTSGNLTQRLGELQLSHASRARELRDQITSLGGEAVNSSGAWGSFAKLIEGGAKMFSEKSGLAVLEEGEDKGLSEYRNDLDELDASCRNFVTTVLLPEQQRSHDQLRRIIAEQA